MFDFDDLLKSGIAPAIAGGILLAVVARVLAGVLDHWRISNYIVSRGGEVQSCRWTPFGPGWFGEKRDRIYFVAFTDGATRVHRAYCKTSLWTGVYFTEDRVISGNASGMDAASEPLREEIARLQEENRKLREQLDRREATL